MIATLRCLSTQDVVELAVHLGWVNLAYVQSGVFSYSYNMPIRAV